MSPALLLSAWTSASRQITITQTAIPARWGGAGWIPATATAPMRRARTFRRQRTAAHNTGNTAACYITRAFDSLEAMHLLMPMLPSSADEAQPPSHICSLLRRRKEARLCHHHATTKRRWQRLWRLAAVARRILHEAHLVERAAPLCVRRLDTMRTPPSMPRSICFRC